MNDDEIVQQFRNFLSWGAAPYGALPGLPRRASRPVPPAWFAYALGYSRYCPPVGVL